MIMTPHASHRFPAPAPEHVERLETLRETLQDTRPEAVLSHFFMWMNHMELAQPHGDWKVHVALYVTFVQDSLVCRTLEELRWIESRLLSNVNALLPPDGSMDPASRIHHDFSYHHWISGLAGTMEMEFAQKKIRLICLAQKRKAP